MLASTASNAFSSVIEAVRTAFEGDPATRRKVAFSIAMIALSAKMAKADGVVTQPEVTAFYQIFEVPENDRTNVARLYTLAQQDVAGYQSYAAQMAKLCGGSTSDCPVLEDILDGLFHIAKSDGMVHENELGYLENVSSIFGISESHYASILARHVSLGARDPYQILGVERNAPFADVRKNWLRLVRENHPDLMVSRGLPDEFIKIATDRLSAINSAYEQIEREKKAA
ncbi:MAG: TerB family tellurite resistance protein [Notoacmeibacter sp.]